MDKVKDDIKDKGRLADEVYDSYYVDPHKSGHNMKKKKKKRHWVDGAESLFLSPSKDSGKAG